MNVIDISPLLNYGIEIFALVLLGILIWGVKKAADYFHIKIADSDRALIEQALRNGVAYAQKMAEQWADKHDKIEVQNKMVAVASNYVLSHAPETATKLGISETKLAEKIIARLPQ